MVRLTRRAFLAVASLATPIVAACRRATPPPPISLDDFLGLSQRLVGRDTLDRQVAGMYLNALVSVPANRAALADLTRGAAASPTHTALENTIIEWWYTGTYVAGGETRLATHAGALMWPTIGVSPPAICGGIFGAWANPPYRSA